MTTEREITGSDLLSAVDSAFASAQQRVAAKRSCVVIYIDTETGGVKPDHPTIQLAAVAMDGDRELLSFEQNIIFDVAACDPEALKINHYSAEAWRDAAFDYVVAARFAAWLKPFQSVTLTSKRTGNPYTVARWAGYNIKFDEPRVRALFGASFCPLEMLGRDVLQAVLFHFDHRGDPPDNYKLSTVAQHFGIATDGAHGALADARMCAAVARAIREAW